MRPRALIFACILSSLCLLPCLAAAQETASAPGWSVYHNPRFNFSLKYPSALLKPQGESPNGDGQVFLMPGGGAELIAYAGHNALDTTLKQAFQDVLDEPGREITSKTLEHDWFEVTGYEGGRLFYRKTMLKNKVFYSLMLLYDEELAGHFAPVVQEIADSFTLP